MGSNGDLISRSALIAHIGDLGNDPEDDTTFLTVGQACAIAHKSIVDMVKAAPAVDAVELPKGRPGDYLEWDNGAGHRQVYRIFSVMICEGGCVRYELASFVPVVGHPSIVRILSKEEVEPMIAERRRQMKIEFVEEKMGETEG
jgi:hypothetical protein